MYEYDTAGRMTRMLRVGHTALGVMTGLTFLDLILTKMGFATGLIFEFSAVLPGVLIAVGNDSSDSGLGLLMILAAFSLVGLYGVCLIFGRRKRWGLIVATCLYAFDFLLLGLSSILLTGMIDRVARELGFAGILLSGLKLNVVVNAVVHSIALFLMIRGIYAAGKLRRMPPPVYEQPPWPGDPGAQWTPPPQLMDPHYRAEPFGYDAPPPNEAEPADRLGELTSIPFDDSVSPDAAPRHGPFSPAEPLARAGPASTLESVPAEDVDAAIAELEQMLDEM